jgi:hypothetical protein
MSPRRIAAGRRRAVGAIVALTAVSTCLGAVAYAATRTQSPAVGLAGSTPVVVAPQPGAGAAPGKTAEELPRTRLLEYPAAVSSAAEAQFRFHVPSRSESAPPPTLPGRPGETAPRRRFQCRLDGGGWRPCGSPHRLTGLALGSHTFAVRALNRADLPGPANSYSWRQVEDPPASEQVSPAQPRVDPKPFSIELHGELEDLYPGYPPQQLPVLVTNPNPVAIEVTRLTVEIAVDPPSCAAENFVLTASSASPRAPLIVPAGAAIELPTASASAPAIAMLNLAVNQDPCRGVEVPLVFDGEAQG